MSEKVGSSKITYRQHYERVAAQKEELPEPLKAAPPEGFGYLWDWFTELHSSRGDGGLPYTEIKAWADLTGRKISVFEIKTLKRIDQVYLQHRNEKMNKDAH